MMLVLTGLHGSGKSYLSSLISAKFGWEVCVKRELLRLLHAQDGKDKDWVAWYRELYADVGPYEVTKRLMALVPSGNRLILDSVHNHTEWKAISEARKDSILATVIAPRRVRVARNGPEDPGLDTRRIGFWHDSEDHQACLASECEWSFNGAAAPKLIYSEFEAFTAHYVVG